MIPYGAEIIGHEGKCIVVQLPNGKQTLMKGEDMKKFTVEITQHAYRSGFYELEAPDEEAAYVLASDIRFDFPHIKWADFVYNMGNFPKEIDIYVTEAKE